MKIYWLYITFYDYITNVIYYVIKYNDINTMTFCIKYVIINFMVLQIILNNKNQRQDEIQLNLCLKLQGHVGGKLISLV